MAGCSKCDGHGNIRTQKGYRDCECAIQEKIHGYILRANIPPRFMDCTLETIQPIDEQTRLSLIDCKSFIETSKAEWVFLFGSCGTGKTHMAVSMLKELISKYRQPGIFYNMTDLLDDIRREFKANDSGDIFGTVQSIPILVLDDIGAANHTDWVGEKYYSLINHRYNNKLITILTTNMLMYEIEKSFDPRIFSRIKGASKAIYTGETDYRRSSTL